MDFGGDYEQVGGGVKNANKIWRQDPLPRRL
jgi:hypothetical protein